MESLIENSRAGKKNVILALSILVNIILASYAVYVVSQNSALMNRFSMMDKETADLEKEVYSLQEKYSLAQYQLQYYKSWAEKHWNVSKYEPSLSELVGESWVNVVAVREVQVSSYQVSYEGVVMTADIEIRRGEGRLLINTDPRIGIDLQASGQTAEMVVENLTGVTLDDLDIVLTVRGESELEVVDGPSAGAAITVGMIAAIQNRTTDPSVFISGTVNPDGTIGKVGGLPYKALAAAKKGATAFLVPKGQSNLTVIVPKEESPFPGVTIVTYEETQVNLQQLLAQQGYDVDVVEVKTIIDAYNRLVEQ